jgi:hypothetical protein
MQQWFDGIYLLGQFNSLRTGCWLLVHGSEAAVLEMPPFNPDEPSPALAAGKAARALDVTVTYLLCTHAHGDHFSPGTFLQMLNLFPHAVAHLQSGFRRHLPATRSTRLFDEQQTLSLGNEPLFLVHAPKHSRTDTMVLFRGAICTGDWEQRTIRSVHDGKGAFSVSLDSKRQSISRMIDFPRKHSYHIHSVFSVHANDRQEGVDFTALMEDTRIDRKLW